VNLADTAQAIVVGDTNAEVPFVKVPTDAGITPAIKVESGARTWREPTAKNSLRASKASAPIHQQLFDALQPTTGNKLNQILATHLAEPDPTELPEHFVKATGSSAPSSCKIVRNWKGSRPA